MANNAFQIIISPACPNGPVTSTFSNVGVRKAYRSSRIGFTETAKVIGTIFPVTFTRPNLNHRYVVKLFVGEEITTVASRAACPAVFDRAIEQKRSLFLAVCKSIFVTLNISLPGVSTKT